MAINPGLKAQTNPNSALKDSASAVNSSVNGTGSSSAGPQVGTGTTLATADPYSSLVQARNEGINQQQQAWSNYLKQSSPTPTANTAATGAGYNPPPAPTAPGGYIPGSAGAGKAGSLIADAKGWLGTPYVYGGSSRSGVDCSGFTQAVYRSIGINIGRTTGQQMAQGTRVGQDGNWNSVVGALQPGDLIFYGQKGASGPNAHVVMYIGNGQVIQAPHTGSTVSVTGLFSSASADEPFAGVRRYF